MPTARRMTRRYRHFGFAALLLGCLLASACTQGSAPGGGAAPAAAPVAAVPFDDAVRMAATMVFSTAPKSAGGPAIVVIDPLVDGVTGEQSAATRQIGAHIVALVKEKYPQFVVTPFSAQSVSKAPYVLVGTFTPVNLQGQTNGNREAFRFCLVMADLRSGRTVAKGVARARMDGVDTTPISFFQDSPTWTEDANIKGYINTCQATKVGDPINPLYLNGILTASMISDAIDAYDAGRYREALELYESAKATGAGDQLRVYNGLYLANWKLGRQEQATKAFGDVVDYGLANNRLGVKLLFKPASTAFLSNPLITGQYDMWIREIAQRSAARNACLQVTGNTSSSGSAALNERLSLLRAEYVQRLLETDAPALHGRTVAAGAGSSSTLVGTGADNTSDALDRRVEFKTIPAC